MRTIQSEFRRIEVEKAVKRFNEIVKAVSNWIKEFMEICKTVMNDFIKAFTSLSKALTPEAVHPTKEQRRQWRQQERS